MRASNSLLTAVARTARLVGAAVAPAGATQTTEPSMTVDLAADGDAEITVVSTFDLDSDDEQTAFDELRNNETAREAYTDRFGDRWSTVANSTETRTGREMAVSNASLELSRTGSTGIATFTIPWSGLADAQGETLPLSEPFASEFTVDRQFVVVLPDSYESTTASPEPASSTDGRLVYAAGTSLDGFSVVAASTETATDGPAATTTGGSGPGFGAVGAVVALLAAAVFAYRRG